MNNKELIDQLILFRKGNEEAFNTIYKELRIPVYTIAYRITYDIPLSEDIVQEIFFKLSQTLPPPNVLKPRAWIFKMARNLALDCKRKYRDNIEFHEESTPHTHSVEKDSAIRVDVEKAINQLDSHEREIVTLRLNAEMKFKDIAELIDQPLGTVLWRYRKAIKKVKESLEGRSGYE